MATATAEAAAITASTPNTKLKQKRQIQNWLTVMRTVVCSWFMHIEFECLALNQRGKWMRTEYSLEFQIFTSECEWPETWDVRRKTRIKEQFSYQLAWTEMDLSAYKFINAKGGLNSGSLPFVGSLHLHEFFGLGCHFCQFLMRSYLPG